jgi:hypothetical protein
MCYKYNIANKKFDICFISQAYGALVPFRDVLGLLNTYFFLCLNHKEMNLIYSLVTTSPLALVPQSEALVLHLCNETILKNLKCLCDLEIATSDDK